MFDGCLDLDVSKRENSTSKCLGGKELTRGLPLVLYTSHILCCLASNIEIIAANLSQSGLCLGQLAS